MEQMFSGCSNLTNLNLGKMNTSSVQNMHGLFESCSKLDTIDLSSFDTSRVTTMESMFYCCHNFKFLNLSHIVTPSIKNTHHMFFQSVSLLYLNIYSFKFNDSVKWEEMFRDLKDDVIYCIIDNSTRYLILAPENMSFVTIIAF